jgi:signal transduction histidine kinase
LNSLYLNLQLLTRKINKLEIGDEKSKSSLLSVTTVIDAEIQRISEILEEFVQYARFAPPELKPDDLNEVIRQLLEMIGENAEKAGVRLQAELSPEELPAMVDRKKLTQALLNLAVNAIQAMPEGGDLSIRTGHDRGGKIVVTITDTGTGISDADLPRIFEPFFTKKDWPSSGGSSKTITAPSPAGAGWASSPSSPSTCRRGWRYCRPHQPARP